MIGRVVSHYKILEKLGGGGMAVVYRAEDSRLHRTVALKFLPEAVGRDRAARERFTREARTASALDHPNICTIFDIDTTEEGHLFLAMACYDGETLEARLRRQSLPPGEAVEIATQVAAGLAAAHDHGVIHRDIKPANLMLTRSGLVKILDFGIAKLVGGEGLTREGMTIGTAAYMSPEQAQGLEVDARTDIWSLGVVLYQMLAGERPFQREREVATVHAILRSDPPPLAPRLAPEWRGLAAIVERALVKDRRRRFQSARELLGELKTLQGEPPPPTVDLRPAPPQPEASIAVLPFADLSPEKDQEYFCHGMAEEVIDALHKVPGLRVASRTSAAHFAGRSADVKEIGQHLQVTTVLEGSVRKAGERLRITVRLVDTQDGYHLWSERFDRRLEDVFAIQEEIARTVTETLQLTLMSTRGALVTAESQDLEAYNLYLMGRHHWNQRTEESLVKGVEAFERALERDPGFARAWVGLANCHATLGIYGARPPAEVMPQARDAAHRALELDESLAEGHASLGSVRALHHWDWAGAEKRFRRALELDPGDAVAHHWYAVHCLAPQGRFGEAGSELARAQELEPLSLAIRTSRGLPAYFQGRWDEAEEAYREALELDPGFALARLFLARVHIDRGQPAAALEELRRARELSGGSPEVAAALAHAHAAGGREEKARGLLEELRQLSRRRYVSPVLVAEVHLGLEQPQEALAALEEALELHAPDLAWLAVRPLFRPLHAEPRFGALLREVGLEGAATRTAAPEEPAAP